MHFLHQFSLPFGKYLALK